MAEEAFFWLLEDDLTELAFLTGGGADSGAALRLRNSTIMAVMDKENLRQRGTTVVVVAASSDKMRGRW